MKALDMRLALAILCTVSLAAAPLRADVAEALDLHILPRYAALAGAAQALADRADRSCDPAALRPDFQAAFDAWVGIQHLHFGPVEVNGIGLAIQFWPDPKGSGAKAQHGLLRGDAAALAPDQFAKQSVAARGLPALERLLYPAAPLGADPCALIRATAKDLALVTQDIDNAWISGYADILRSAGAPENTVFLTKAEARQALFTQIITSLEFAKDLRLGRPLGSFDAPMPARAESVAAGRSAANLRLQLDALRDLTAALVMDVPQADIPLTLAAFDRAIALAKGLNDPVFAGVSDPQTRLRVEILQQAVAAIDAAARAEMGPKLGVSVGFNAADGD